MVQVDKFKGLLSHKHKIADVTGLSSTFVQKAGDTMTGVLNVAAQTNLGTDQPSWVNFSGGAAASPAHTNVCLDSQTVGTGGWAYIYHVTPTQNYGVAPDSTTTSTHLVEDNQTDYHYLQQAIVVVGANTWTYSIYAKAGTRSWLSLYYNSFSPSAGAYFDLVNGVVGNTVWNGSATITSAGNGWWRCTVTQVSVAGGTMYVYLALSDSDRSAAGVINQYLGNGTGDIQVWGAQIETGATANSYIATTTTAQSIGATYGGGVISSAGAAANIGIVYSSKGTGFVGLGQATSSDVRLIADQPIADSSGNQYLGFVKTASAVNELTITNAATANNPTFSATGGDTNIGIDYINKGIGIHRFKNLGTGAVMRLWGSGGSSASIQFNGTGSETSYGFLGLQAGLAVILNPSAGKYAMTIGVPASGTPTTNYPAISFGTAGNPVTFSALGDDTNIGLMFLTKGTGRFGFSTASITAAAYIDIIPPATEKVGMHIKMSETSNACYSVNFDRASTSVQSSFNWQTNGVNKWNIGQDNNATENLYFYDWVSNRFFMKFVSNAGDVGIGSDYLDLLYVKYGAGVGIGHSSPTAKLHINAGTTAAGTAPLKFTSGTLLTAAEAGAVEFLTDSYYGTITTGSVRKTFAFLESPTFTGTPTLPTGTIATTQAAGDNSTKVATTAYVDTAVATGGWVLVYDYEVTGAAVSDVTASGLDGDVAEFYKIEFKLVGGAAGTPEIYMQPNADAATTSYRNTYATAGSAVTTATNMAGIYATYCDGTTGLATFEGTLFSKSGPNRLGTGKGYMRADGTSNPSNLNEYGYVWLNSATNITSIKFNSSVASGIGVGSHFMIWRKA